jgi:lipid-binding SYLF domain-containing protein
MIEIDGRKRIGSAALRRWALVACMTAAAVAVAGSAAQADSPTREEKRIADARSAYLALFEVEEAKEIPQPLLEKCRCVAVFPGVVKGALGWGGRRGSGVLSCRDDSGTWSAPTFMTLTGGSVGLQIGVEKADVVLFVMNSKSAEALADGGFTLGAKGSIAAGPVGRTAEGATDLRLDAEIYSYARSKGLFAGLSLEGAHLGHDVRAIERFYGKSVAPRALLFGDPGVPTPEAARTFLEVLPRAGE